MFSKNYRDYISILNESCPVDLNGCTITSAKAVNNSIVFTYRFDDIKIFNAIKKIVIDDEKKQVLKEHFTLGILEYYDGIEEFYNDILRNKVSFDFRFETPQQTKKYQFIVDSSYLLTVYLMLDKGMIPTKYMGAHNLEFKAILDSAMCPAEISKGIFLRKVKYNKETHDLEFEYVLDEAISGVLPKRMPQQEINKIKNYMLSPNTSFYEAIQGTVADLNRVKGGVCMKYVGSITGHSVKIYLSCAEIFELGVRYRLDHFPVE